MRFIFATCSLALLTGLIITGCKSVDPDAPPGPPQAIVQADDVDLPIPTAQQAEFADAEIGMFIHFDIEVFDPYYQHAHERAGSQADAHPMGAIDPGVFNPTKLDTDQWLNVARRLGARYAVFTAKHSSGFLMWQSDLYPYGVKQSPWQNGHGDVVMDYLASCRRYGILPGIYCSAGGNSYWRLHHPGFTYRNGQITGEPLAAAQFLNLDLQMYEDLWRKTGPLFYMWFDGGVNAFDRRLNPLIEQYQPQAVCFNGPADGVPGGLARWTGNEKGFANYPLWNTTDVTNDQKNRGPGSPTGKYWVCVEANVPLRYHIWMWQADDENKILSLSALMTDYLQTVGRGSNFIINANIDPDGLIPDADAKRLAEFGDQIRAWFGQSLAETKSQGKTVELDLPSPTAIDFVSIMEDIRQGQRIEAYTIEGRAGGKWKPLCSGQSIGHKRIQQFDRTTVDAVRLRVTQSLAEPIIRKLAVYNIEPLPPDPTNPATTQETAGNKQN